MSLAECKRLVQEDRAAYSDHLDLAAAGAIRRHFELWTRSTFPIVFLFRLANCSFLPVKAVGIPLYKLARILSGIQIKRGTRIGGGLLLPHYGTIVINRRSQIGPSCVILHNVTLGAKGGGDDSGVPEIGSHVYIGAGAVLLGSVRVGDRAIIGANSVVIKDVAEDSIAVGNPAKVIPKD